MTKHKAGATVKRHSVASPPSKARWTAWRTAGGRLTQSLARPLPAFTFERGLERLRPAWVLIAGGLLLTALFFAIAADLPERPGVVAVILPLLGLAGAAAGLVGLRSARVLEGLAGLGRWLGVGPGQAACLLLGPLFALLAGLLSRENEAISANPLVANLSWALALGLIVVGGWAAQRGQATSRPSWALVVLGLGLLALGLLLRGYNTTHIPVTFTGDEGSSAINAEGFISGRINNLFGVGWHGFPSLYYHLQSLPILLFGRDAAAARLSSVVAGALTVVAVYLVGRSMFGHMAGLAAGLFLAGFHYHLHFSRIGLNNAFDGLAYVLVFGAVWHGWKTERRASWLLAGLALGLSQYFYPSTRMLFVVVPGWLLVAGLLDRQRLARLLPDLALMALAAAVTYLPLGWYYLTHPDQFFGSMQAVSILGPNLVPYAANEGVPVWEYLLRQAGRSLGAYFVLPLKYWYKPGTPLLRLIPAALALLALARLAWRPRDPRLWLLLAWVLAISTVGALSESTPAAQRYVGVVGACALLVGFGLAEAVEYLRRAWPRLAPAGASLVVAGGLLLAADEARFYLLDFTPRSQYGGARDFEGLGAAVSERVGNYMEDLSPEWQLVFFGTPVMGYDAIPSLLFRVPDLQAANMTEPWGAPGNPPVAGDRMVFVFLPGHESDLAEVQAAYPGGLQLTAHGIAGDLIMHVYQVPPPSDAAERAERLAVQPAPFRWPMSTLEWGVLYLAALAAWCVSKAGGLASVQADPISAKALEPRPVAPADRPHKLRIFLAQLMTPAALVPASSDAAPVSATPPEAVAKAPARRTIEEPTIVPVAAPTNGKPAAEARPPEPDPTPPVPARARPAVANLLIALNLKPGARLRIRIEDVTEGEASPTALVWQEVQVPENPANPDQTQPATVALNFDAGAAPAATPIKAGRAPAPRLVAPAAPRVTRADAPNRARLTLPRPSLPTLPSLPAITWPAWLRPVRERLAAWAGTDRLGAALFFGALGLYLVTRLIGLDRYPVYFFTDEAAHTVLAADFIRDGLRNYDKEFLPTYFSLGPTFNLNSVTVYLQVIPFLLFGKSMIVTRAVSALMTLIGAVAVGLTLRDVFKARYWWVATLLLSTAPAWFLHSRTAFENVQMAAYYAGFIYFYLRYRTDAPRYLYGAVVFGALTFYTHGLGLVLMAVTAVLLLLTDLPYHWRQRAVVGRGLLLALVLALPYFRYALAHPSSFTAALRQRGSYWLDPALTLDIRVQTFVREYLYGLSPQYWFGPQNTRDLQRHLMNGYGNLWLPTLPLAALGLLLSLRWLRVPAYRVLLLTLLATPVGSALVAIGVPRMLWFIIPAVILMGLGLNALLTWLEARRLPYRWLAVTTFALLGFFNLYLFTDALRNGALWPTDYTLGGVQWGARQLFGQAVPDLLDADPELQVYVSPNWANGTELLPQFFMTRAQMDRMQLQGVEHYLTERRDLPENLIVVLMANEYERVRTDPKFANVRAEQVLNYPNGSPGFYFVRFDYSAEADALFGAQHTALGEPVTESFTLDAELVTITHPQFGAGQLNDLLDGDRFTLVNAPGANPLSLDFVFEQPRALSEVTLITGSLDDMTITVSLYAADAAEPMVYGEQYVGLPPDPTIVIAFTQGPELVQRALVEITDNLGTSESVNIHVREIQFR